MKILPVDSSLKYYICLIPLLFVHSELLAQDIKERVIRLEERQKNLDKRIYD